MGHELGSRNSLALQVGESPSMGFYFAHVQMPSQISSLICDLNLSSLSPLAPFSLLWVTHYLYYLEVLPLIAHATEKTFPSCSFVKRGSHFLHFTDFGIYCLRNLAGADHKTKHGEVIKPPEFFLCWSLEKKREDGKS